MTGRFNKVFTLVLLVVGSLSAVAQENKLPQYDEGWRQQVTVSIAESEYEIRGGAAEYGQGTFYAVNRRQDLRAEFSATGVNVTPRLEQEATWSIGLSLMGLEQYGSPVPAAAAERKVVDRSVTYFRGDIVEIYTNEKSGVLLDVKLSGSAMMNENSLLAFQLDTNLETVVSDSATQIDFYSDGMRVARIGLRAPEGDTGRMPSAQLYGNKLLILVPQLAEASNSVQMALTTNAGEDTQVGPSVTPDWVLDEEQPDSNFALSVAAAGDVNGDGFSDVVVGAPDYDVGQLSSAGRVLVYAGSSVGLSTSPIWTSDGEVLNGRFGSSIASGDFNNDTLSDIVVGTGGVVGADRIFGPDGEGSNLAIVYAGSSSGNLTEFARIVGEAGSFFGFSVDSAGDVNNDGVDDIIVGAPAYANNGRAYVYFSPFPPSQTNVSGYCLDVPDLSCSDPPSNEMPCDDSRFGFSVSGAGDVDGDGTGDFIVGDPLYDITPGPTPSGFSGCSTPENRHGEAFVYLGVDWDVKHTIGVCSSVADWCSAVGTGGALVGASVDTAGDVDGDGLDDVIVGAPMLDHNGRGVDCQNNSADNVGAAIVFRATGGTEILQRRPPNFDKGRWTAYGASTSGERILETGFGTFVASAGDVNGDGVGDILVGAANDESLAIAGGAAFLYMGSIDTGPKSTGADPEVVFGNGACDLSGVAFSNEGDWSFEGSQRGGNLGRVVAGVGDVDGDGFSDILAAERGSASVFRGGAYPPRGDYTSSFQNVAAFAGDFNGDGYDDMVVKRAQTIRVYAGTDDDLRANPETCSIGICPEYWVLRNNIGPLETVAGAGDINGDGYADIIIGLPTENEVRIFAGRGNLSDKEKINASWVISAAADPFGTTVSSAGDVNGDGFSDIIVGDPGFNNSSGRALVFLSGCAGQPQPCDDPFNADASVADWSSEGFAPGARFGSSVASAGDINADGYSDVIVGAPGHEPGHPDYDPNYTGDAFLYLGSLSTPLAAQPWTSRGYGNPGGEFGASVASAGDVNGDGFGDVVVGAPGTDLFGEAEVGQALVYLGSAAGLSVIEAWFADGLRQGDRFGQAVGSAGDVNADGLTDLVAGAFLFLGAEQGVSSAPAWPDESVIFGVSSSLAGTSMSGGADFNGDGFSDFSIGGRGPFLAEGPDRSPAQSSGISRLPQQLQTGGDVIAPLGASTGTSFQIRVRRPDAPGRYGLEWEIKPLGAPFDGSGLQRGAIVDYGGSTGLTEMELTESVGNLEPGTPYRWRARILTDSVAAPHSPWLSVSGGTQGTHLLTAGARAPFPFSSVGPAQNMTVFADTPPPIFQWHAGANSSFEIEWAGNADFSDPLVSSGSLSANGNDIETYEPDATLWLEILRTAQNPDFREAPVFWRIATDGGAESETRALRIAAAAGPSVTSPTDGQTSFAPPLVSWDANHNDRFQIRFSATEFLGEPLIVVGDDDDTPDAADEFNITGTGIIIPDAIWADVEALVPPGSDGTGTVYFAVRAVDALGRPSISDVRSLKVNATGTAAPQSPRPSSKSGGGVPSTLFLTFLVLLSCARAYRRPWRSVR